MSKIGFRWNYVT